MKRDVIAIISQLICGENLQTNAGTSDIKVNQWFYYIVNQAVKTRYT